MSKELAAILDKLRRPINGAARSRVVLTLNEADKVAGVLERLPQVEAALEKLYVESERPYAVYGAPAVSSMEQLGRFESARIGAARMIGLERLTALVMGAQVEEVTR